MQIRFARRVSALSGLPLAQTLLDFTNLYVRFGLGRDFDPATPLWRDYLAGLSTAADPVDWTWCYFLTRPAAELPGHVATFGCFAYALAQDATIRLHFADAGTEACSPLADDRRVARLDELRQLFEHVRRTHPQVRRVAGASWLYNLSAYRRLFPESYLATATVAPGRLRNMPLWGQFLDRRGAVRREPAAVLLDRVSRQTGMENIVQCFPLQPLAVAAPVEEFYAFHDIM